MDALKYLSVLLILLFFKITHSQTGPGGVGNSTSNGLWLRADNVALTSGSPLNTWSDVSGNNNDATSASGEQPLFLSTSSLNNMPTIRLDGIDDQMTIIDADILDGTSGMTFLTVLRPNNLDTSPRGILGKRVNQSTDPNYAYTWYFHENQYLKVDINTQNNRFSSSPTTFSNNSNYILQMHYDGSLPAAQRSKIYNGQTLTAQSSENSTSIINSNSNLILGALNYNYGTYLGADISELIHYNYALNTAEQIIVNNYLSAKYNIALSSNDIYIQDNAGNGNFDHNVAGIGQAPDGSNHTDSQGSGIVRISNPTDLDNDEFLFWGEETKNPTYDFSTNTSNYTEQLNSRWRVRRQGNVGRLDVTFDISSMDLSGMQSCANLQLVVDNDYDFSSPEDVYDLTISGTNATTTNVRIRQNRYFTLRYTDQIVWNGTAFYNGSGAANVPNTLDSCLKLVIKPGGAESTLNDDAHVREVLLETGGPSRLTINNTRVLQVDGDVVLEAGTLLTVGVGSALHVGGNLIIGASAIINNFGLLQVDGDIIIESGGTIGVSNGGLIEVENNIENNDGYIYLSDESQLIQNHIGPTANSGDGILTIKQQGTGNVYNYNYWSSPVNTGGSWQVGNLRNASGFVIPFLSGYNSADSSTSPVTLSSRWLHTFNGPIGDYNAWVKIETNTPIAPGIGYTMKGSGGTSDYIFRGSPNDGDYSIPITAGNEILIGNPYPSTLNADQFITDNLSVIDGSLYFWESFTTNNSHNLADYEGGYATRTMMMGNPAVADNSGLTSGNGITSKPGPTQYVSVGQGFFVRSPSGGTINFNNAQRDFAKKSANETVYYKTNNTKNKQANIEDNRPKLWFSMIDTKGFSKTIGLGYDTNTTLLYDRGYDAEPITYLKDHPYWLSDNKKLIIQALPDINTDAMLPLVMEVTNPGLFKFSISEMENIPDDLNIYLLDNDQNIYYNLREDEAQLLINTKGNQNQFSIVFQKQNALKANDFHKNDAFVTYNSNLEVLELHYNEPITNIGNLKFYNTLGQEVKSITSPDSSRINISQLVDGVYILKIETKSEAVLKNIKFVKY